MLKMTISKFNNYGCYICHVCGKKTRDTGNDEASVEMCKECYNKNLKENEKNDKEE